MRSPDPSKPSEVSTGWELEGSGYREGLRGAPLSPLALRVRGPADPRRLARPADPLAWPLAPLHRWEGLRPLCSWWSPVGLLAGWPPDPSKLSLLMSSESVGSVEGAGGIPTRCVLVQPQ